MQKQSISVGKVVPFSCVQHGAKFYARNMKALEVLFLRRPPGRPQL